MTKKFTVIILIIFLVLSAIFFALKTNARQFNFSVLMGGNILMAALSFIAFFIVQKNLNDRPEAFVRGVYGATFLKLLVCMGAILLYALLNRENLHKPSLFLLFGIYAVYTAAETWLLSKLAREKK